MHRPRSCAALAAPLLACLVAVPAFAQRVVIRRGTPAHVVDLLKSELIPQRFVLVSANEKAALFTLDRGLVTQRGGAGNAQVVLELRIRFKVRNDGLEVTAAEEVATTTFPLTRQPVRSPKEIENLQRLLDRIRTSIDESATPSDSATPPESRPF